MFRERSVRQFKFLDLPDGIWIAGEGFGQRMLFEAAYLVTRRKDAQELRLLVRKQQK